jgi:hypothetical protein
VVATAIKKLCLDKYPFGTSKICPSSPLGSLCCGSRRFCQRFRGCLRILPDTLKTDLEGRLRECVQKNETPQSNLSALVKSLPVAAPKINDDWLANSRLSGRDH